MTIPGGKFEDALVRAYWQSRAQSGWWLLELPIGYPTSSAGSARNRRIDAVVLPQSRPRVSPQLQGLDDFAEAVEGADVEIVEAKRGLNTAVIGQLLCGLSMFTARYPNHGPLKLTALVHRADDAALKWYCHTERIEVVELEPLWKSQVPSAT